MAIEKHGYDVGEAPGELDAQIMIVEGLAQSLSLAARNLRSIARYWYIVASAAFLLAIGTSGLLLSPPSGALRLLASDTGQTLVATAFTGLLCISFYCLARTIGLRHLACEAEMLCQSNREAVTHGHSALESPY